MFSRNKPAADDTAATTSQVEPDATRIAEAADATLGKGRPTPKRKEVEAANRRPLVPTDRKAATKEDRAKQRERRALEYQAMQSGDERYLPVRDKGPVKRYIRAYVDARRNLAEFFLPAAFVLIAATLLISRWAPTIGTLLIVAPYLLLVVAIIDTSVMWRRLKKRLEAKFDEVPRGAAWYASMRAFQLRRLRMPKPTEPKHGVYPS